MRIVRQNIGIDVDLKELKVSLQALREDLTIKVVASRTFSNSPVGFKALVKWADQKKEDSQPLHFTMEATGIYHENLAYFLHGQEQATVHVELPNKTAAYKKSLNIKSKTDPIDAKMLGHMGAERHLEAWHPGSGQMREIKKLSRERLRLVDEKTMVSNQLHAEMKSFGPNRSSVRRYDKRIKFLIKQIGEIEKELEIFVAKDKTLQERIDNVCTAKGMGFISAVGIVAETDGFALFKSRNQLVSYAGYDVKEHESGTSVKGKPRISKKGNSNIRRIMYMPAMSAARSDENHKNHYQRIVGKSGIKMKANVAIQRKLLLMVYTLFTKNEPYDPEYRDALKKRLAPKKPEAVG